MIKMNDTIERCGWCGKDPLYVRYHDEEWGKLVTDDKVMFEFLVLESSQAGLSWITILRRRGNYRKPSPVSMFIRLPDLPERTWNGSCRTQVSSVTG